MLQETQTRLTNHFRALSEERRSRGYPVYTIEHCLTPQELIDVQQKLCQQLRRSGGLTRDFWLLWTVIAAEIGYTYNGEEYWRSFAGQVDDWRRYGSRSTIRSWYGKFSREFSGFTPSGRWAEHFSIIAWPISHSILPKYLQWLFVRHFYELRHSLAAASCEEANSIGELFEKRYYGGSSRFQDFLQQTALTGRFLLALRDEDVQGSISPIYPPTLTRIVKDLESKTSSRGFLRDARRVLRESRFAVRGGLDQTARGSAHAQGGMSAPILRGLNVIARRRQDGAWAVGVALPDISNLLKQTSTEPSLLDKVRVRFCDRQDWMPGRALYSYSNAEHALKSLPGESNSSVIQFKETNRGLALLASELEISTKPPWLLRINDDGVARQVMGKHVRSNEEYLFICLNRVSDDISSTLELKQTECLTSGVFIYEFHTPQLISPSFLDALTKLGLGFSLQAQISPFGLVPRWDASGSCSAWLPTEEILLRLSADFEVAEFVLALNGESTTRIGAEPEKEIIISLGRLPIGRHRVQVLATPRNTTDTRLRTAAAEVAALEVREPANWQDSVAKQAGIRAIIEPAGATLEALLARRATLNIHGPAQRSVAIEARLYDAAGHCVDVTEIGKAALPASDTDSARVVDKLTRDPLAEKIQSASRIELAFLAEELGSASVSFPHTVAPLRWKMVREGNVHKIRLIDECGATDTLETFRYDIAAPDRKTQLELSGCIAGSEVAPPGGLYCARYKTRLYAAFASVPAPQMNALADLGITIALSATDSSPRDIMRLLYLHRVWRTSSLLGSLVSIRKSNLLRVIERGIEALACGSSWADKAERFRNGSIPRLENLQRDVGGSPGFALRMRTNEWTWKSDRQRARTEFCGFAKTYGVSSDETLCELALQLAFQPALIKLTDPEQGADIFIQLAKNGPLARGASLARLSCDRQGAEAAAGGAE